MSDQIRKVVVAYSGGLDTSVIVRWIRETYRCEVVTFTADLGQEEELDGIEEKAKKTGAVKAVVSDLREEFVRDYVFPALQANAVYEGLYLMGTSLARPLISKHLVEIAKAEGADAIAHGATGKGNDQVRFELSAYALNPEIKIVAPWREWDLNSRESLIAYAERYGIPVPVTQARPYSTDRNLFHISFEGGILEDPWAAPPEDMFVLTVAPEAAPDEAEEITLDFKEGIPTAVNGRQLSPAMLLTELNRLAGKHGIGRLDIVENRFVGMKARGVYETPGGTLLHIAHRAIESITMDREVMHLRDSLIPKFAELVYNGFWFSPEMEMLSAAVARSQRGVTGTVRLKLYKGNCIVEGRKSPNSLYNPEFATFEADEVYNQKDAEGFIRLNALRLRIRKMMERS